VHYSLQFFFLLRQHRTRVYSNVINHAIFYDDDDASNRGADLPTRMFMRARWMTL